MLACLRNPEERIHRYMFPDINAKPINLSSKLLLPGLSTEVYRFAQWSDIDTELPSSKPNDNIQINFDTRDEKRTSMHTDRRRGGFRKKTELKEKEGQLLSPRRIP